MADFMPAKSWTQFKSVHLGADLIFNPVHAYQKNCIEFCEKFVSDINFLIEIFMFVPK